MKSKDENFILIKKIIFNYNMYNKELSILSASHWEMEIYIFTPLMIRLYHRWGPLEI